MTVQFGTLDLYIIYWQTAIMVKCITNHIAPNIILHTKFIARYTFSQVSTIYFYI